MTGLAPDPASFRDPDARVLTLGGRIFRAFSEQGAKRYEALQSSGLLDTLVSRAQIVAMDPISSSEIPGLEDLVPGSRLVLEHPRIPFLSYCYEWPFEMLRAAALLQLDLMDAALEKGFVLKDAKPYNVQFVGHRPVHIDITSFEPREEGSAWTAYTQFCRTFLNPLLLESLTGTPYQPWLRSCLDGIAAEELARLLPLRKKLRRGVFGNVVLQAWLNTKFARLASDMSDKTPAAEVGKPQILKLVSGLRTTIEGLAVRDSADGTWVNYEKENTYDAAAESFKDDFVERALAQAAPSMVWDLGCNTGRYSLIASRHSDHVVALDGDIGAVGALLDRVKREGSDNILCLFVDLLNPSPGQGWDGQELKGLTQRTRPDFCLCLALIHHLAISGNLPLSRFLSWLAGVTSEGVIEFVPKADPMVKRLLRWREDVFDDYRKETFEAELEKHFRIIEQGEVPGSERTLYAFGPA